MIASFAETMARVATGLVAGCVVVSAAATALPEQTGTTAADASQRYHVRLPALIEPDEPTFDARFAQRFDDLLAPAMRSHSGLRARITSGPATVGETIQVRGTRYVGFGICQAHQCDNTTLDMLYEPHLGRLVGLLLDQCAPRWLGQPDPDEQAQLTALQRAGHPAAIAACAADRGMHPSDRRH